MNPQVVIQNMNVLIINSSATGLTAETETMLDYYVARGVELPRNVCEVLATIPRRGKVDLTELESQALRTAHLTEYPPSNSGTGC